MTDDEGYDAYNDGWPDAAANSIGCYHAALAAIRERKVIKRKEVTGIEINEAYFNIALRRIAEACRQPRLFAEPAVKPVQEKML